MNSLSTWQTNQPGGSGLNFRLSSGLHFLSRHYITLELSSYVRFLLLLDLKRRKQKDIDWMKYPAVNMKY